MTAILICGGRGMADMKRRASEAGVPIDGTLSARELDETGVSVPSGSCYERMSMCLMLLAVYLAPEGARWPMAASSAEIARKLRFSPVFGDRLAEPPRLGYDLFGHRLAPFAAARGGALGFAGVAQLGDEHRLLELADSPEDLLDQHGSGRRISEVRRGIDRHQLDALAFSIACPTICTMRSRANRVAFSTRTTLTSSVSQKASSSAKPGRMSTGSAPDTAAS